MRATFRHLHDVDELFVMPNPWDVGSAMALEHLGFGALATTSSGHAASLGRTDGEVNRQELVEHVRALSDAVDVPLNADSERCFGDDAIWPVRDHLNSKALCVPDDFAVRSASGPRDDENQGETARDVEKGNPCFVGLVYLKSRYR